MREIASRYPITYKKVGKKIEGLGYDLSVEPDPHQVETMMLAILAAMPPHVIPYGSMGDNTPWGEIDWRPFVADLRGKAYSHALLEEKASRLKWEAKFLRVVGYGDDSV